MRVARGEGTRESSLSDAHAQLPDLGLALTACRAIQLAMGGSSCRCGLLRRAFFLREGVAWPGFRWRVR